jgi:hypothetical protein
MVVVPLVVWVVIVRGAVGSVLISVAVEPSVVVLRTR